MRCMYTITHYSIIIEQVPCSVLSVIVNWLQQCSCLLCMYVCMYLEFNACLIAIVSLHISSHLLFLNIYNTLLCHVNSIHVQAFFFFICCNIY